MSDSGRGGLGDGLRTGVGILMAFKEAVEETVEDALNRGDLSPEGARAAMKDATDRLQQTMEEARDRFDFVPRREFEALRAEVAELRSRVAELESRRTPIPTESSPADPAPDNGPAFPVD